MLNQKMAFSDKVTITVLSPKGDDITELSEEMAKEMAKDKIKKKKNKENKK